MKKGEIYEETVERIEFPNKGVVVMMERKRSSKMRFRDRRSGSVSIKSAAVDARVCFWRLSSTQS